MTAVSETKVSEAQEKSPPGTRSVGYTASRYFAAILEQLRLSLLVSTYQAGKLLSIGVNDGQLQFAFHDFEQVMGVAVGGDRIAIGTRRQVHFLQARPDLVPDLEPQRKHDNCWLPRMSLHTGSIHVHDLAWGREGLWAVNTLFSCLCTLSNDFNFVPRWRPSFVSQLIDQDRCHLNGLAMENGQPRYVTVLSETDTPAGWRDHKLDGGAIIDVGTGQVLARGLCMPHSPRVYQSELWVLNSGRGQFGRIDTNDGRFHAVAALPGYTRGLAFSHRLAFVGLSRIRETNIFGGLPIGENPDDLFCGVGIVDLASGETIATLRFVSGVEEIFAVELIPGSINPKILGPGELEPGERELWVVPAETAKPSEITAANACPIGAPAEVQGIDIEVLLKHATAAQQQGDLQTAYSTLRKAHHARGDSPEVNNLLGNLLQDLNRQEEAITCYERALEVDPHFAPSHQNLGVLSAASNAPHTALKHFEAAHIANPTAMNMMLAATTLPVIYESQAQLDYWRERVESRVADMVAAGIVIDTTDTLIPSSFSFAYHGKNDRSLMENLAKIYRGIQCCAAVKEGGWKPSKKRLRVGFLSAHFYNHTIGRLNIGVVERLPRSDFEVVAVSLRRHDDQFSKRFQQAADQYIVVPRSPREARLAITELKLDILIFADVGMDSLTQTLCYSRMAPIQAATWGHPVTTGSPAIDYFISSDLAEPEDAQKHYSEQLIRLPGMGVYYERPSLPAIEPKAEDFGLPPNRNLYLCPQTLFKFHPAFDAAIERILRGDPAGELVTIAAQKPSWTAALQSRWRKNIPDCIQRIHFLPPLEHARYLQLLRVGDVMLDPFPFGGGNTSYEAIAMGTPVVTLQSDLLRGRLTTGMYRKMQNDFPQIQSIEQYTETAIQVACDPDRNTKQRQWLISNNSSLFSNDSDVFEYAQALRQLV